MTEEFSIFYLSEVLVGYPERKTFGLFHREEVVPVEISNRSYDDNYEEGYETGAVVY
ncbi:hypothetical protein ACFLUG_00455 [Chloroflexota bacterium]